MAELKTLIKDIQGVLVRPPVISDEQADELGRTVSRVIQEKMNHEQDARLRMSNLGSKCLRKLWYSVNKPDVAEPLPANARLKFMYGDLIEALVLWLAKLAGHKVEGEQDTLEINGVKGHRDAKIDGVTIDVKSASPYGFKKFEEGLKPENDAFGYLDQLGAYAYADGEVQGAFLAVDKTLGNIVLDEQPLVGAKDFSRIVEERKALVAQPEPPAKGYFDEAEGASGNRKLAMECSYCQFKYECWGKLRVFAYSNGPKFLTKVVKEPNVPEIK